MDTPITVFNPDGSLNTAEYRRLRVDVLGLSQQQMSERLGVTLRTVHRWEHGQASPQGLSRKELERLTKEANRALATR